MKRFAAVLLVATGCAGHATQSAKAPAPAGLRIEITSVPKNTPPGAPVFLAGSFNGWRPGAAAYQLHYDGEGKYSIDVPDTLRGPIEFKFTRGSWETVELDSANNGVPNRQLTVPPDGRLLHRTVIANWQDPSKLPPKVSTARPGVSVISTSFAMPQLGRTRRVWLYLPPDYATTTKRYPVLYMHDGQNVFDAATSFAGEWGVDETLDSLALLGGPEAIVVAVDNGDKRLDEYSPYPNAKYGGGEGDKYIDFIINSLKPYVDSHYRTLSDRGNTAIAGSSMGGLISLYAALRHPEVFSRAGVFSPALWFNRKILSFARDAASNAKDVRMYIVSGALEGASEEDPGVYMRDQNSLADSLSAAGLTAGKEFVSVVRADGKHSEWFWRREFPAAYVWLFKDRAQDH